MRNMTRALLRPHNCGHPEFQARSRWINADQFDRALGILHQRDVRYISFFGASLFSIRDWLLITNGWLCSRLGSTSLRRRG
jgi:hypothetical protein